ncbi:MAG: GNAT family N-acetyltransferase [Bryobacteraceae bacterium]|nr:GNAT family N-acetyltransferase [Bryobacteraceae bacterium]
MLRRMSEADAAAVEGLLRLCPEAGQWLPGRGSPFEAYVAEQDGRIDGVAVWQELPGGEAELLNLAVRPEARRRGVGRALLTLLSARKVWLEVRSSNEAAIRFYESQGFRVYGLRRNYYRDPPDDAVLMVREAEG